MSQHHQTETVSNASVLDLIETCCAFGLLNTRQLKKLGIKRSELLDPMRRFPESKLISLWHWVAANAKPAHIGLLIGQQINPSAKGILASWVSQCDSLGEALNIFQQNISLMNPSEQWRLKQDDKRCTLTFTMKEDKNYPSIALERSLSAMTTWGRILSGHDFRLIKAEFSFSEPVYSSQFTTIFGADIKFNAPANQLIFNSEYLKLPVISGNHFLKSIMESKAQKALEKLNGDIPVARQAEDIIEEALLSGNVLNIDRTCEILAISRQTLYRKLKQENTDYKTLLEHARKARAIALLSERRETVTAISLHLGYQETSSFYKAFKRWFGISPKDYINNSER